MGERKHAPVAAVLTAVGSAGVLGAMLTDGVAVAGRHLGLPLTGSIELSQLFIVLLASCSIALATLHGVHATVDLLHQRLGPKAQLVLLRLAALLGLAFLAAMVAGSAWLASDLWGGNEHTELLHIPIAPLRVVFVACGLIAAAGFLVQVFRPHNEEE